MPDVYPVPGVAGVQLSNWAPHFGWISRHPAFLPYAEPPTLLQEAHRVFGPPMTIVEKADSTFTEDKQIYHRLMERVRRKGALCRHLLAQDHFDLVMVVFTESHTAAHQFWNYRPESPTPTNGQSALTHAIRDVYQAIDREFSSLLEQLPSEANIFVVSSVGIEGCYPTTGLTEAFCRQLGYQASPEPAAFSLHPLSLARRMLPESWRVALSRHLPRDTRERLLADQFRSGTNWQKTTAFALPAFYNGLIRVNLRGREPQGIVSPGAEYEALLDRLESDLRQLIDPQTGKPAVQSITRPGDLFGCSPPAVFPDLWVRWQPTSHFMDRVIHPKAELVQPRPEFFRNSNHSCNGFVAAAGPSISRRGDLGEIEVLDLAPTFLALMGEPVPQNLTGKIIAGMGGA
ncbi:MAG: alkaline phosphatase family protein [Abditibacteriales bacterium]|nr:alkaline phosphatase family protein [Abditibacteriales bacterium]MDW8365303.1 alkaline phosphatase family protein [Abditibacteriales bacterium]